MVHRVVTSSQLGRTPSPRLGGSPDLNPTTSSNFRVGGREVTHGNNNGTRMTFESFYRDIVPDERIVYTSTLSADEVLSTVSLTTVELTPSGDGTRLVLTEQGAFLDGLEQPSWREQGTGDWLDALGTDLKDRSRT